MNFFNFNISRFFLIIGLICFSIVIVSCGGNSGNSFGYASGDVAYDAMETADFEDFTAISQKTAPQQDANQDITRKVVKTGGITFESKNLQTDYTKLKSLLPAYSAYIEHENQNKSNRRISYDLTVRIPVQNYDSAYKRISNLAYAIDHKYSNIEDVTSRYYDLKTRIRNKKALEERYIELLNKASEINDILDIERNLNQVRTEIEQMEGQFKFLNKQISYSTLNISFYQTLPYSTNIAKRQPFGERAIKGLNNGWYGFVSFIVGFITLWPFIIVVAVLIFLFRKWRAKRLLKKANKA